MSRCPWLADTSTAATSFMDHHCQRDWYVQLYWGLRPSARAGPLLYRGAPMVSPSASPGMQYTYDQATWLHSRVARSSRAGASSISAALRRLYLIDKFLREEGLPTRHYTNAVYIVVVCICFFYQMYLPLLLTWKYQTSHVRLHWYPGMRQLMVAIIM